MWEPYFQVVKPDGEKVTIEINSDGEYELVTEFDRRIVSEAYVDSLRRDAHLNKSVWMVSGGLPSLGKRQ